MIFKLGLRRIDCALELGDMSPSGKAVTCHRTPQKAARYYRSRIRQISEEGG